ncbi:hypothetical protein L2E82_24445 [Cichorium intybus]|uniref:Uncharacterized protein n=1 Tax=Cichorium intybus TaxID=13427 RepID=A0ACB9E0E9_CICIN|nr:hypothetical protein L2E82_24445 [Cichorium intybus]
MDTEEEASGQMTDEIYTNGGDEESLSQQQQRRPIISGEQLDIEAYAALYTGRTKISRLISKIPETKSVGVSSSSMVVVFLSCLLQPSHQHFDFTQEKRWPRIRSTEPLSEF